MFILQLFRISLRGLQANKLRSLLATLGVIIGVGAVVSAVSILRGAERDMLQGIEALGADQLIIFNGQEQRGGRGVSLPSLEPEDADAILRENPDVVIAVAPQYSSPAQIKYFANNTVVTVLGTTADYAKINNYLVEEGEFISDEDVQGQAMKVVLGNKVAQDLFGALPPVGKTVKINDKSFHVVGVMEHKGALGFFDVDNQVIIPVSTAMDRMFGARFLTSLVVQGASAHNVSATIESVKKTLRAEHRLKAAEPDDFQIFTQERFREQLGRAATIFAVVLYSIAGISLVVGGIGIMNIMLVSVTERTREIGVRIAVGARRFDILRQFLMEASLISLMGGLVGVGFGWAIANLIGNVAAVFTTYTPPSIIVMSLVMAGVVGIVSGIYPAVRAAGLDPVQALRYE